MPCGFSGKTSPRGHFGRSEFIPQSELHADVVEKVFTSRIELPFRIGPAKMNRKMRNIRQHNRYGKPSQRSCCSLLVCFDPFHFVFLGLRRLQSVRWTATGNTSKCTDRLDGHSRESTGEFELDCKLRRDELQREARDDYGRTVYNHRESEQHESNGHRAHERNDLLLRGLSSKRERREQQFSSSVRDPCVCDQRRRDD